MVIIFTRIKFIFLVLAFSLSPIVLSADNHTPNLNFDFLPKFVHYQGEINVNGKSLSEIETGIDFIEVSFINQTQFVSIQGKQVEIESGQFIYTTFYVS